MPKGTSRAEATSNSEKIKLGALAVIELHWSSRPAVQPSSQPASQQKILLKGQYAKPYKC